MKRLFRWKPIAGLLAALLLLRIFSGTASSQQPPPQANGQELVANLAAGRVIIAVVKDAILIATIENPIEADTRPPAPVEIESSRAGILLGPID
jgi:hypothetical protein